MASLRVSVRGDVRRLLGSALLLAGASTAANVVSYVFSALMSRQLVPAQFGRLASLLSVLLVAGVPALALQAVAARRASLATTSGRDDWLIRQALALGAVITAGVLGCTPLLVAFLHVQQLDVLLLSLNVVPLLLVGAAQGVLQGAERFSALGTLFVAAAAGRLLGGVAGLVMYGGVRGVLAGTAVGGGAAAVLGLVMLTSPPKGDDVAHDAPVLKEFLVASASLLGIVLLTNLDLLLARHYLSASEAGAYAVGSLLSKVAFWLPQAVATMAFPRLADPERRAGAVRTAVVAVVASGTVVTIGAALAAGPVVRLLGGSAYTGIASSAWLFACSGALLALAQLLIFARLARLDARVVIAVAGVLLLEVLLVVDALHGSVREIIATTAGCAALLVLAGALAELTDHDGEVLGAGVVGDQDVFVVAPAATETIRPG